MKRYFYLAASLPDLDIDRKPPMSFADFLSDADVYFSKSDKKYVAKLREHIDIENIRRLLLEQKIDDRGNLDEKALDEAILAKVNLPDYTVDFLSEYTTTESRIDHFAALYALFYSSNINTGNKFIDSYLQFEHELRLWLSVLRAQKMGIDFSEALQFEDPQDPLVMSMLVQSSNVELVLPQEFKLLKDLFNNYAQDPLGLQKKLEEFRLNKITQLVQDEMFVIDNILGFMAKLLIIEQWQSLNQDLGLNRLNRFSKSIRNNKT